MFQSFSHAENFLLLRLLPDVARTLILEVLHLQASEDHPLPADGPHHQIAVEATETLTHIGPDPCLDPGLQDATERARGHSLHDLDHRPGDVEDGVTAQDEMEAEGGEAQVIVATVVMMKEAEAEVVGAEVEEDVKGVVDLTF